MSRSRRLNIIQGFLIVWISAIVIQLFSFSFLGTEIGGALHPILGLLVFLIGLSCQVLFQGPSAMEILEVQRRKRGASACTIDYLYLKFTIDRAVRIGIIISIFLAFSLLTHLRHNEQTFLTISVAIVFGGAVALRAFLIYRRVISNVFGTNEYEARELLRFLTKMYKKLDKDFHPPGGMKLVIEPLEDGAAAPSGAEYAN